MKKNRKGFKAIGVAIGAAIMSAAMAFSACVVPLNDSGEKTANKSLAGAVMAAAATSTQASNSLRFVVSNAADFETTWNTAVNTSKTKNKQVYFVLDADWEAPTTGNHAFGADSDGFSYGRITVPSGADIVLDLNGHSINRKLTSELTYGSNIYVAGGKLTLEDGAGGGTITGGHTSSTSNVVDDYDCGGGICVADGGMFTMNGGTITQNYSSSGGGINTINGTVIINGGTISNNHAICAAGAIAISGGLNHEINGGVISDNEVYGNPATNSSVVGGGAIEVYSGQGYVSALTVNGGKFTGNTSPVDGGAILLSNGDGTAATASKLIFNDGEIVDNHAARSEGAISMGSPTHIELNGGLITENTQGAGATIQPDMISGSTVKVGGPVKIYNNYDNSNGGAQANLCIDKAQGLKITGNLTTEKGSAYIGITTGVSNNGKITTDATGKTNGYTYTSYTAAFVFSDDPSKRIAQGGAEWQVLTTGSKTAMLDAAWEYQIDGGSWQEAVGSDLSLTYGQEVTAVRIKANVDGATLFDWQAGGTTTSTAFTAFNNSTTAFTSVSNAGYYSFLPNLSTVPSSYKPTVASSVTCAVGLPTFTVTIQQKDIKINIKAKSHEYGDKLATLEAEVDPSTPLATADASTAVSSFVELKTEATSSSDLGTYSIKGALKSTAPASIKNNYKISYKTATYTVEQATITVKLKGSNTYNGKAQNPTFNDLEIAYPNGNSFAGTKLSSDDVTITPPTGGCVNAKKYGKNDISISLKTTEKASRFKLAATDPVSGEYEIKKVKLTCKADDFSIGVGDAKPTYTATYTGFVNGEDKSVFNTQPTFTCAYDPTDATNSKVGDYTITVAGAEADNYEIDHKPGKVTVSAGGAAKPTIAIASGMTDVYDGTQKTFNIGNYNANAIKSVTLSDTTGNFVWNSATPTVITATKAGKCKVTFTLDTTKYTWTGGSKDPEEIEIEVKPMPLVFSLTGTGDTNWKWDYGATGTLDYSLTTTTYSGDTLALEYRYYLTSEGSGKAKKADSATSLDVSKLASGSYTAEVILLPSSDPNYSADNANYTIDSNSKNTQAFVIDAGNADTSKIVWQYSLNGDPETALFNTDGTQVKLTYGLKTDKSENEIEIPFPADLGVSYLTRNTTHATLPQGMQIVKIEDDSSETVITGKITKPGNYKITIALVSDDDHLFDNGTKYAEVSKEFKVDKAEVSLTNLKLEYGWINDDTAEVDWKDYDPSNLPVYQEKFVYIRVKGGTTNYPDGITNAEIVNENTDYIGDRDLPGTVKANVKFTLDPCYVYNDGTNIFDTTFTYQVSIELSKQKIPVSWVLDTVKDASGNEVPDANGLPYQIYVLDFSANPDLAQYVKYEYYYADTTGLKPVADTLVPSTASGTTDNAQLDHLIDVDGAGKMSGTSTKSVDIIIRPVIDTSVTGYDNYVLDLPGGAVDGADQYTKLGQKKSAVTVTQVKNELVYGTKVDSLDSLYTLTKGTAVYNTNFYTAVIYKGTDVANAKAVSDFDFAAADVGTYTIKFELKPSVANSDALSKSSLTLEITQQEIEVPQITGNIVFNSETLKLEDFLDAKYKQYLDAGIISAVSGRATARDVGNYVAVIEIISPNYKWKLPADDKATSKMLVKLSLADEQVSSDISLDSAAKQAEYSWKIAPYKLGTDIIDLSGKDGAKININKLPEWARTMLNESSLIAGIAYYADQAGTTPLADEEIVLKGGREYFVGAVLGGDEAGNFTFANDGTVKNVSPAVTYKVPQSGAAALMNNVKDFVTKTWLGLPIWAWMLIALALIILLIIIIVVAKKRRKSKEEREEIKARKQEEKERREEERRMQQERIQAERELAMAKQQAELEKIRAQAQAGMGAGMATMAMQQAMPTQPQQQQMQQPMQAQMQQQPQQQPVDNSAMQRLEAELAEMRMRLAAAQTQQPMNYPTSMQPAQSGGDLAEIKMQLAVMRAEQQANKELSAMKTELEMARLASHGFAPYNGQTGQQGNGMNAELLGDALIAAFAKLMAQKGINVEQQPQIAGTVEESSSQTVLAQYPSDAVITTTTTVDTTKKNETSASMRRERDDARDSFADVDGFYDSID
ncbi:MAG: hypothetical protein K2N22_03740 [Clostridia bacterium]|nr:hypothetical protein [Clostridia bacterium]